jgi:hypothetical protein
VASTSSAADGEDVARQRVPRVGRASGDPAACARSEDVGQLDPGAEAGLPQRREPSAAARRGPGACDPAVADHGSRSVGGSPRLAWDLQGRRSMPESSQPPHPPVSTIARMLATVALLHGSGVDRDTATATAVIDTVAYLTSTGDDDGADALIRLVTTDPDTPSPRPTSRSASPPAAPPQDRTAPRPRATHSRRYPGESPALTATPGSATLPREATRHRPRPLRTQRRPRPIRDHGLPAATAPKSSRCLRLAAAGGRGRTGPAPRLRRHRRRWSGHRRLHGGADRSPAGLVRPPRHQLRRLPHRLVGGPRRRGLPSREGLLR